MTTSSRASLALAAFVVATPLVAQTQAGAMRDALVKKLDSIAAAPVLENRATGLAVAVVRGNDTLLLRGYGKADVEWNVAMPADAMFEIGSITKQFTAAAILQLRDEGKLRLDDDISKYVPAFDTKGNKVPLRRLLDHTSGIKGITEIPEFRTLSDNAIWPRDSAIALMSRYPFDFPPGEAMIYNNSAFILLGHVIEKASGLSYEDYVEKKIFAPLGMTRSMYCNSIEIVERRAHAYQLALTAAERAANPQAKPRIRRPPNNIHTWPFSAGSLCSTAGDLVAWLQALHGGKVLTPKSYTEMTTPSKLNDGTPLRYGYGIAVTTSQGRRLIGHGGAITGFVSQTSWYPDAQLAVVVLISSNGPASPEEVERALVDAVFPGSPAIAKTFTGDASPFVGTYTGPARGRPMTMVVTQGAQGISVSPNGAPARGADWVDAWTFRVGDSFLTFKRASSAGPASELRFDGGGGLYVLKRQP